MWVSLWFTHSQKIIYKGNSIWNCWCDLKLNCDWNLELWNNFTTKKLFSGMARPFLVEIFGFRSQHNSPPSLQHNASKFKVFLSIRFRAGGIVQSGGVTLLKRTFVQQKGLISLFRGITSAIWTPRDYSVSKLNPEHAFEYGSYFLFCTCFPSNKNTSFYSM